VTRAFRVQVMYHLCVMIAAFGIFWEFGVGWATMIGGGIEALFFLYYAETDEKVEAKK
jgi:hypothetical protein